MSPAKRRAAVEHVRDVLGRDRVSERRACQVLGPPRSTQRPAAHVPDDEPALVRRMVERATRYGRSGYRRVAALLRAEGFAVNHERVERPWRPEGRKVPARQPARRRLWRSDGSCVRLRPAYATHVRGYHFVNCRTAGGRAVRLLAVIDERTRACPAIDAARRLTAGDVLHRLSELFILRGLPAYIRPDNGPAFAAKAVRGWLGRLGVTTALIEPGSPWESGYVESLSGKLRDERLSPERFDALLGARVLVARWRRDYDAARPHSALGYRPPAPEARLARPPQSSPTTRATEADN